MATTSDPVTIGSASSEWHRASQCHGLSVGPPCVYPSPTSIIYHLSVINLYHHLSIICVCLSVYLLTYLLTYLSIHPFIIYLTR